jgi:acetyl-CoA carboxylase biotin carboxyl carrier protein
VSDDPVFDHTGLSESDLTDVLSLLSGSDVLELDLALNGAHLRVRRSPGAVAPGFAQVIEPEPATLAVTSPLVGVFHPSVQTGQEVQAGQPLGAIEALGMPTSVEAPQGGSIEQLLVEDGRPVEYGQPLLVLRRS